MDVGDDLGPRQVEQVGVAGDVARVVAEALAAVSLLARGRARWSSTPQAPSSTSDPLVGGASFESVAARRSALDGVGSRLKESGAGARGLFRRLVNPVAKLPFKALPVDPDSRS